MGLVRCVLLAGKNKKRGYCASFFCWVPPGEGRSSLWVGGKSVPNGVFFLGWSFLYILLSLTRSVVVTFLPLGSCVVLFVLEPFLLLFVRELNPSLPSLVFLYGRTHKLSTSFRYNSSFYYSVFGYGLLFLIIYFFFYTSFFPPFINLALSLVFINYTITPAIIEHKRSTTTSGDYQVSAVRASPNKPSLGSHHNSRCPSVDPLVNRDWDFLLVIPSPSFLDLIHQGSFAHHEESI
eukprot:gene10943-7597_t